MELVECGVYYHLWKTLIETSNVRRTKTENWACQSGMEGVTNNYSFRP